MSAKNLGDVIGKSIRAIRNRDGVTLDQVALSARRLGLNWNASRVADMESRGAAVRLPTLILLAQVLGDATGRRVRLSELVQDVGDVALTESVSMPAEDLRAVLDGGPVELSSVHVPARVEVPGPIRVGVPASVFEALKGQAVDASVIAAAAAGSGLAEQRAAATLGVDVPTLAAVSVRLWGASLGVERDRRADLWSAESGRSASAQKRGQITRELLQELRTSLESGEG